MSYPIIKRKKVKTESGFYLEYMILDTPCFPARYYVGFVNLHKEGYVPADNSFHRFHRTLEEAEVHFNQEK